MAVPVLVQSLEQARKSPTWCLQTLAAFGPAAAAALPALWQLLASPDTCALHPRARLTLAAISRP